MRREVEPYAVDPREAHGAVAPEEARSAMDEFLDAAALERLTSDVASPVLGRRTRGDERLRRLLSFATQPARLGGLARSALSLGIRAPGLRATAKLLPFRFGHVDTVVS